MSKEPIFKRSLGTAIILALVLGWGYLDYLYRFEPVEVRNAQHVASEAARFQHANEMQANRKRGKYFCELAADCAKFGTVRQECAVAGDYEKCLGIRLGLKSATLSQQCDIDGSVGLGMKNEVPNALMCAIYHFND